MSELSLNEREGLRQKWHFHDLMCVERELVLFLVAQLVTLSWYNL
jgi:hypothetical protein